MGNHPATATRRAVLGAAIALPALAAGSVHAAPTLGASTFNERLEAFKRAHAVFVRACDTAGCGEDELDAATEAAGNAYDALIATPAPDMRATVEKLAALAVWSRGCQIEADEVLTICADAERILARGGRA
ncbi:hypothetical protein [Sphingomonas sp. PWP1-2]|uniref:hypothetical protein n=1 Tax=Sphingomonas sp. PWP1-2 TaxID=2804558 RepID=UPI003CF7A554